MDTSPSRPSRSDDWRPVLLAAAPALHLDHYRDPSGVCAVGVSPDGHWWWDGSAWVARHLTDPPQPSTTAAPAA